MCDEASAGSDSCGITAEAVVQTLVLEIRPDDLKLLRAAQLRIVLARSAVPGAPVIVWHSLEPFEINTVAWREAEYGLYASIVELVPGARVTIVALIPEAQAGYYYSFTSSAVFEGPYRDSRVGREQYGVQNAMPDSSYSQLTFGLTQDAQINSTAAAEQPVTALSLAAGSLGLLCPVPMVYVWLDSGVVASTVIQCVGDDAVTVDYSSITTKTLIYDPDLGRFVAKPEDAEGRPPADKECL